MGDSLRQSVGVGCNRCFSDAGLFATETSRDKPCAAKHTPYRRRIFCDKTNKQETQPQHPHVGGTETAVPLMQARESRPDTAHIRTPVESCVGLFFIFILLHAAEHERVNFGRLFSLFFFLVDEKIGPLCSLGRTTGRGVIFLDFLVRCRSHATRGPTIHAGRTVVPV